MLKYASISFAMFFILSGCASESPVGNEGAIPVTGKYEGTKVIYLKYPVGDHSDCANDPAVAESFATADLPGSRASYMLKDDAENVDIIRIVECLQNSMKSGEIFLTDGSKESAESIKFD